MTLIRFGTYRLDYGTRPEDSAELIRRTRVAKAILELDCDVLAVQGVGGRTSGLAATTLSTLAGVVGMKATTSPEGYHAFAWGMANVGVGLLWRPDVEVAHVYTYRAPRFHHGLVKMTADFGRRRIQFGSYHAPLFGKNRRADEAEEVIGCLTRPMAWPTLVGMDASAVSADQRRDGSGYYDGDPFSNRSWDPEFIFQCDWDEGADGSWWVDRFPGSTFLKGGFCSAAAVLDVPWQATSGHHPTSTSPPCRPDDVKVTKDVRKAIVKVETVDTEELRELSEHLPVVVTIDPDAIGDE